MQTIHRKIKIKFLIMIELDKSYKAILEENCSIHKTIMTKNKIDKIIFNRIT